AQVMVDDVIGKGKLNLLKFVLLGTGIITLCRAVFGYVKEYMFDYVSARVNEDLKVEIFNHIQEMQFSYFDKKNTGELMSRIGEDVDNIWRTISFALRLFIENILYFAIASVILFYKNWILALVCLITMPLIAVYAVKLEKRAGEAYDKISDQIAEINTTAQENIAGVRLVKAFARERHEILKFLKLNKENCRLNQEQSRLVAKYYPNIEFITNLSTILMIAAGGILVMKNYITLGTLIAFNGYIGMLIHPMRMFGWLSNILAQNNASAKKIFRILDTKPTIKNAPDAINLHDIRGAVEFKNVSFRYNEEEILKNVSLKAAPGETIAIMGTTGAGKSTIVNLIGRYYDVTGGEITIDGHPLKKVNLKDLRSQMSVVSQDVFLFSESIADNIRVGNN
ncbi:MAG: ATP-binding cassette domain-containing protein, partial [Methanobacterium paludis]|nr:ATP-binding cassette domain-containing protein [Methanobacterium paludis]